MLLKPVLSTGCFLLALIACQPLTAQDSIPSLTYIHGPAADFVRTPYNPKGNYNTFGIKGKVLPYIIGNGGGISAMLGLEYGFAKNQSIGIDGFINSYHDNHDDLADTAGVNHTVGYYYKGHEKAVMLNYRYYFNYKHLRETDGISPYVLAMVRYGQIDQYYDPLYPLDKFERNHEDHVSFGLLLGSIYQFEEDGKFGLDINLGVFEKQKDITRVYLKNGQESTVHTKPMVPGFRLSVNLMYWFYRNKRYHGLHRPKPDPAPTPKRPTPWSRKKKADD